MITTIISNSKRGSPVLRHLKWLCTAPSLLVPPEHADGQSALLHDLPLAHWLPADWPERLAAIAGRADRLVTLEAAARRRLGHYFEALYACLLQDLLGWDVIARNLPVREGGRTLGELDFLVRNPRTGQVEHHEIAIKFYLGCRAAGDGAARWYGPNSRDRLDLKAGRLLGHQARLSELPATRSTLARLGLPLPDCARVWMPGYLFYPREQRLAPPADVAANHLRGYWARAASMAPDEMVNAVPLEKPHWIGPWQQAEAPDSALAVGLAERIAAGGVPRLFVRLRQSPERGDWREVERFFLVPERWPQQAS
ncbi:MAG: hypothetical protein CME38_13400 [Haliea sp.]|nr:hypothetical protein [Haliea sp.]